MSSGFFTDVMDNAIELVNEEFDKLRVKKISKDNVLIFFNDDHFGIEIYISESKSRIQILNMRLIKISMEIQEKYSLSGFCILVNHL